MLAHGVYKFPFFLHLSGYFEELIPENLLHRLEIHTFPLYHITYAKAQFLADAMLGKS